jgi:aspartate/methionine/tyrosine aminotransferase
MRGLASVAERSGIRILVDEVYRDTIFQERPVPAAERSERFVSTSSLTKAYGLASLRCGWSLASPELTRKIRRARDLVDVWSPIPADRLSVLAFAHLSSLSARAGRIVERNSGLVRDFLAGRPDLECAPFASTLAFPRIRGVADSDAFVDRLFAATGTAVVPGRFFDSPAHFRISFGGPTDQLEKGLAAIARCLDDERDRRDGWS